MFKISQVLLLTFIVMLQFIIYDIFTHILKDESVFSVPTEKAGNTYSEVHKVVAKIAKRLSSLSGHMLLVLICTTNENTENKYMLYM